jgi:ribosome biogenesis GTPase A
MTATFYPIQSYILGIPLNVKLLNSKSSNAFEKALLSGFYYSFSGKVLILGNANVGKTCITRILIGKKPNMKRHSTEGIQVHANRACINKETKKLIPGGKSRNNKFWKWVFWQGSLESKTRVNSTGLKWRTYIICDTCQYCYVRIISDHGWKENVKIFIEDDYELWKHPLRLMMKC